MSKKYLIRLEWGNGDIMSQAKETGEGDRRE